MATNLNSGEVQESESEETGSDVTGLLHGNRYEIVVFSISTDEKINPEGSDPLNRQTREYSLALFLSLNFFDFFFFAVDVKAIHINTGGFLYLNEI